MDPEQSSDEEPAEILNETDAATTEPVHIILQEEIDEDIDDILKKLRDVAPSRPFEPALWDGVMAISPLTAWGVLTINGHELGRAFSSLNAKNSKSLRRAIPAACAPLCEISGGHAGRNHWYGS